MKENNAVFFNTHQNERINNDPILSEHMRVTIRIWYSKVRQNTTNNWQKTGIVNALFKSVANSDLANVGHVTIQTPNAYASIWPATDNMDSPIKIYKADFSEDFSIDDHSEGGSCDVLVSLYSLNIAAIEQAFKKVIETQVGYALLAETSLVPKQGQNCCTLSYRLLRMGGIDELEPMVTSMMRVFKTPNQFANYIRSAKKNELERYQQTKCFKQLENEYIPTETFEKNCIIS